MNSLLYTAALLAVAISIVHSWLGERYILMRLFRRDNLPHLFGSADFTRRTLRWAWHLTTVAWLGFAAILVALAQPEFSASRIGAIVGVTFLLHFAITIVGSRGRHLAWILFLAIGVCSILATGV